MDRESLIRRNAIHGLETAIEISSGTVRLSKEHAIAVLELLKERDKEHNRLLSWLGKFCRHIDNGDTWLTDEENLAFFKEKMKQQFGWDTD